MKKWLRFVSAVLIASVALSFSAASLAEETTRVFIPNKIGRLVLPDLPEYVALRTRTESVATYGNPDDPTDPCPILPVTGGKIELFFSEQPDWAMVLWAEGPEPLNVSDTGYAQTTSAGHKYQPGWWDNPDVMTINDPNDATKKITVWANTGNGHIKGHPAPAGRDEAYLAGKDNVVVQYGRSGTVNYVEYTIEDDFYHTGMDGAVTVIRYEPVIVDGDRYIYVKDANGNIVMEPSGQQYIAYENGGWVYKDIMQKKKFNLKGEIEYKPDPKDPKKKIAVWKNGLPGYYKKGDPAPFLGNEDDYSYLINTDDNLVHWYYTTWYISKVITTYPEDNYIVEVESDWRNDAGQFLYGYKITYSPKPGERYRITYAPRLSLVLEDPNNHEFSVFDEGDAGVLFPFKFYKEIPSTDMEAYITDMITTLESQIQTALDAGNQKLADSLTAQLNAIKDRQHNYDGTYVHRYDADMPIYGEYWDGTYSLVSGSGDYLRYWYEEGHGRRVRKFDLVPCTSFPSPRIQ